MLHHRLGVERARDDALPVHVKERTEIGQRAEVHRVALEHVGVAAFGRLIPREVFLAAGAREEQLHIVGMLFDEGIDARERFLVGEGLRAHTHRHRGTTRHRLARAGVLGIHQFIIGARGRRDYASSERAPVKVKIGSRSPEKNAIMSETIARQLSSVI